MSDLNFSLLPWQQTVFADKNNQFSRGFSTVDSVSNDIQLFDAQLIKQDLYNHFNTKKGERVMYPEFGTIIWDLIYEPLTESLKQAIQNDVNRILRNDPRLRPTQVFIIEKDFGLLIEATVEYSFNNQVDNLQFTFNRNTAL
jgi:phage baseplate assembly protein W